MKLIDTFIRKASRDTSSGSLIAEIDGLRFIAILAVVLFHLAGIVAVKTGRQAVFDPLAALLGHGDIGVRLFFVISGFVIALPFGKAHLLGEQLPSIRRYFTRRLTRLEPPYIVNLLFLFALIPFVTHKSAASLVPHLLASMTYMHNLIYGEMSAVNNVSWSLEIELQFYTLAPLLAYAFAIRSKGLRRSVLAAAIAAFAVLTYVVGEASPRFSLSILSQGQFFLTGFLLVDVFLTDWEQKPSKSALWDLVSLSAWAVLAVLLFSGKTGMLLIVVPMFFAYCAAFRGTWSNRLFRQPLIYVIGGMCYTIYLYHNIVIWTFGRVIMRTGVLNRVPLWLAIIMAGAVIVPLVLAVCTVLFIAIEKPCMKKNWHLALRDRLRGYRKAPSFT